MAGVRGKFLLLGRLYSADKQTNLPREITPDLPMFVCWIAVIWNRWTWSAFWISTAFSVKIESRLVVESKLRKSWQRMCSHIPSHSQNNWTLCVDIPKVEAADNNRQHHPLDARKIRTRSSG